MSKVKLTVTTQGVRGGQTQTTDKGYALLTAHKNGTREVQISIDTFEGEGSGYKERDNNQIEVYFPSVGGEFRWIGTPEALKKALYGHG